MSYNFFVRSNITFGKGAVKELPGIIKGHGLKKVLLVYDGGVKAAGIAGQRSMTKDTRISGKCTVIWTGICINTNRH